MPTLGLHMIVGANEAFELERCLKSVQGLLFDEVVVSCNGNDPKVEEVARKYATKVITFTWVDDFAAARNHALSHVTTDYVMWLDADDVVKPSEYRKLLKLKPDLDKHEVIWLTYNYGHDEFDNPNDPLPRERIFRNRAGFHWEGAVHEIVVPMGHVTDLRHEIAIDHYRTRPNNPMRNVRILEREWRKPDCSNRMKFYYARDFMDAAGSSGDPDMIRQAEEVAIQVVENDWVTQPDEKAALCRQLAAKFYQEGKRDLCERYCYLGLAASSRFAELYSWLGCMAYDAKDEDRAITFFEAALACRYESLLGPWSQYYKEIPAQNLFMIYFCRGDYAKALLNNKLVLECRPTDKTALEDRELTWRKLLENLAPYQPKQALAPAPVVTPRPKLSVFWCVPFLNLDDPATRIRRYNVSEALARRGINSQVLHGYHGQPLEKTLEEMRGATACVLTQVTEYDRCLAQALRAQGTRVVVDVCEALFGLPGQAEIWSEADRIVCCSTALAKLVEEKGFRNVAVIKDAVEVG